MKHEKQDLAHEFDWGLYPHAENFLTHHIDIFLKNNNFARILSTRLERETSTRFFDWIDHIVLPDYVTSEKEIKGLGFQEIDQINAPTGMRVFVYPKAIFFPILLSKENFTEIGIKPERLDHFIQTTGKGIYREGDIYSPYRKAIVSSQGSYILSAVERRGSRDFIVPEKSNDTQEYRQALETFFCRQRYFEDIEDGMDATQKLLENVCTKLSAERVTDAFFRAERMYWERKNKAGQMQKTRQDRFGLGWGNHDHHTYRSSRKNFTRLIKIFETLGFLCREQFFAGEEAGWGAQILEHPKCNIVLFADVDLQKEEKVEDFSHNGLQQTTHLGTVGLWVELHGESMLQAGLHHLAARFNFEKLRDDLRQFNIGMMNPFSYFEFLKQAFSEVETWNVDKNRLNALLEKNSITNVQYEAFLVNGAIGSHLENLQRTQGFKGFNQHSVSAIINATDPRKYHAKSV